MPKRSIHPEWYSESRVFCDGQLVLKVGSTRPTLSVDVWSGTHPAYASDWGSQQILDREGRVGRFLKSYSVEGMGI